MHNRRLHQQILAIAESDNATERCRHNGTDFLRGKCIHCNKPLAIALDGKPLGDVTVEHIIPKCHGGDDSLDNTALACGPCNHQKGYRIDHLRKDDPRFIKTVTALRAKRRARLRVEAEA